MYGTKFSDLFWSLLLFLLSPSWLGALLLLGKVGEGAAAASGQEWHRELTLGLTAEHRQFHYLSWDSDDIISHREFGGLLPGPGESFRVWGSAVGERVYSSSQSSAVTLRFWGLMSGFFIIDQSRNTLAGLDLVVESAATCCCHDQFSSFVLKYKY